MLPSSPAPRHATSSPSLLTHTAYNDSEIRSNWQIFPLEIGKLCSCKSEMRLEVLGVWGGGSYGPLMLHLFFMCCLCGI